MKYSSLCGCILFAILLQRCISLDPISGVSAGIGIAVSLGYAGFQYLSCRTNECCDKTWITADIDALEKDIQDSVYGQHLVKQMVPKALSFHTLKTNPKKALVMSFHGWTGSGKNFVSNLIIKHLFKLGQKSKYVHMYIGSRDFAHKSEVNKYRDKLRKDIEEATKLCGQSLFVFDEVDKMAPGILDALKPYTDYHEQIDGVDYRKNIFIFLSNSGGNNITELALAFWTNGRMRQQITLKDMEPFIAKGAFNEVGGLQYSELVKMHMIDLYVPFLPLEKKHVKMCIKAELHARQLGVDEHRINLIADQLIFAPDEVQLYSISGCKKISQKVDLFGSD